MRISVIIPVFNDPEGIDATLRSVTGQRHPAYEVIPVDNNSTDETPSVLQEWASRHPALVRPTAERTVQSSYAARNAGIERARGEILVFLDANMTAPQGWLQQIDSAFSNSEIDYLGYEVEIYIPEGEGGVWGWYDQATGLPSRYHYEQKQFVPTSCLAVRKEIFERVGRFEERLMSGGDKEFGLRVHRHPDLTTGFRDDIVVYHPARTSFREHYEKEIRIGRGLARLFETSTSEDTAASISRELLLHVLPPNPLRVYRRGKSLPLYRFLLLYAADLIVRYVRLYGALTYLLGRLGS